MQSEVNIQQVLDKCEVLKRAQFWPSTSLRPRAWLGNFDEEDKEAAALLLNEFVFIESRSTDLMIRAAIDSLIDGLPKGPRAPSRHMLVAALDSAIVVPVTGENPNPTDSGNYICSRVRRTCDVPEERIFSPDVAIGYAKRGHPILFVDDFVGSGDQFLKTWFRGHDGTSFSEAYESTGFIAMYAAAVSSQTGLKRISEHAPVVGTSFAHVLSRQKSLEGIKESCADAFEKFDYILTKYVDRLIFTDDHFLNNPDSRKYGYKSLGLTMAFEHSVPDATLPIFWASGVNNWIPLIRRT